MLKILLSGCSGQMGRTIAGLVREADDLEIIAGIDPYSDGSLPFPVYASASELSCAADVAIDFSAPAALGPLLDFCVAGSIPAVIATTGLGDDEMRRIESAASAIPVFQSANMSLGVNLLIDLVRRAARVLSDSFDIEIIEKHHNKKVDAPSGTALMIAGALTDAVSYDAELVYDRHNVRQKRQKQEIGIHTVRGGGIVGEHEVMFVSGNESLTISHSAASRGLFAAGAVRAARFLVTCEKPGVYGMPELVSSIL